MEVIGLRFPNTGQDSVLNERCRPVTGTLKTDAVIRRGPLNFRPITIITTTIIKIILIITIIVTITIKCRGKDPHNKQHRAPCDIIQRPKAFN